MQCRRGVEWDFCHCSGTCPVPCALCLLPVLPAPVGSVPAQVVLSWSLCPLTVLLHSGVTHICATARPFLLDPAALGAVGTVPPGWGKGEGVGDVAQEGLMQSDFYPVA